MKLSRRLILANATTVIVPLIITALVALVYINLFGKLFGTELDFKSFHKLSEIRFELSGHNQSVLKRTPEIIEEKSFQNNLQQQLAGINGEVIILKNDHILFSSQDFDNIEIAKSIEIGENNWNNSPLVKDGISYSVELIRLKLQNNSEGTVILLAPLAKDSTDISDFFTLLGLTYLISFIATNILISYQLSKTIVSPLRNLQQAAREISKGNLSHPISEEGDQEIRELCRDLELMKIKLKESIHTQLKYEENRKMLVSSISHDLKTPVTTIKGYIEGILDGVANSPEKTNRYLNTINLKARQVDQMIDDLLLYAKLDLNQIPFNYEKTEIETYLREVLSENEPELDRHKIQLTLECFLNHKQYVSLDRDRIKRVIMNILDNSSKYMDKEKRQINVFLRETAASIIIELRDNGSGINRNELPYIFERFYRSDTSRSEIKGSGLGLAIAKEIIEGHGGKIWAVSHGTEGTSVLISLKKLA